MCGGSKKHKTGEEREGDTDMTDIYICKYVNMYIYKYVYIYIYMYITVRVCVCIYICRGGKPNTKGQRKRVQTLKTCNYAAFRHTTMRHTNTNG